MGDQEQTIKNHMIVQLKLGTTVVSEAPQSPGDSRSKRVDSASLHDERTSVSAFVDSATQDVRVRAIATVASSGIFRLSRGARKRA
jgi:hypothetical protein